MRAGYLRQFMVDTYGVETLRRGSGVLDVGGAFSLYRCTVGDPVSHTTRSHCMLPVAVRELSPPRRAAAHS
jgi:hypothetical protein